MAASEIQAQIEALAQRLSVDLADLASFLGGYGAAEASAVQKAVKPGLAIPVGRATFRVPELLKPSAAATAQDLLRLLAAQGIKERPYDDHSFFVAAEPVDKTEKATMLGVVADVVMVEPTIDAQIEFNPKEISNATPTVSGGTVFRNPARTTYIKHKAISKTLAGQLFVWSWWYQ